MELLAAALLGVVQGLTEFLPISSSAHLILVPWLFGLDPGGLVFDVAVHVGTSLAVLIYFWREWISLSVETVRGVAEGKPFKTPERRLACFLVIGTIPALVAGLALEDTIESHLRSPYIPVATLIIFGALLYWAERRSRLRRTICDFQWSDSVWIGMSQAIALIPGVSRSGITITTALLRDVSRTDAARFSFLLSTPVIVGAGLLESLRLWEAANPSIAGAAGNPATYVAVNWGALAMGVATAAVTGILCIRYFLRYLETRSFLPFVIYRFVLAAIVLVVFLAR